MAGGVDTTPGKGEAKIPGEGTTQAHWDGAPTIKSLSGANELIDCAYKHFK